MGDERILLLGIIVHVQLPAVTHLLMNLKNEIEMSNKRREFIKLPGLTTVGVAGVGMKGLALENQ